MKYSDEEYRDIILRAFEYMYCQVNTFDDYDVNPNKSDESAVQYFISDFRSKLPDSDNIDYILNFIESQFDYYVKIHKESPTKYPHGLRTLQVSWIIGKPAIKRHVWFTSKYGDMSRFKRFVRTKIKSDLYSKFEEHVIYDNVEQTLEDYIELDPVEENFKKLYYNQEHSLSHCLSGTYLCNPKSNLCTFCDYRQECKELLKKEYPNLYRKRGYE